MTQHTGNFRSAFVILCVFVVTLVTSVRGHAEERTLVLPYDEACPFFCFDAPESPGLTVETLQYVFKKNDVRVEFKEVPYARARLLWAEPDILAVGLDEELEGCVRSRESLGAEALGFFMSDRLKWKYAGTASLLPLRLGYVLGVQYIPEIDVYIARHADDSNVVGIAGDEAETKLFQLLEMNRIDVFLTSYSMGLFQIQELGARNLRVERVPDSELLFYAALCGDTPGKEELIAQFDQQMKAFWDSDRLLDLERKYRVEHATRPAVK